LKLFPGSRDDVNIYVEKFLYAERYLDITSPLASLTRPVFLWRKLWKFRFPITKDVSLHPNQIAHFADLEVQFFRYCRSCLTHTFR